MEALLELGMAGPTARFIASCGSRYVCARTRDGDDADISSPLRSLEPTPEPTNNHAEDDHTPVDGDLGILTGRLASSINGNETVGSIKKANRIRKRKHEIVSETFLRDFGPPRQSERIRTDREFPKDTSATISTTVSGPSKSEKGKAEALAKRQKRRPRREAGDVTRKDQSSRSIEKTDVVKKPKFQKSLKGPLGASTDTSTKARRFRRQGTENAAVISSSIKTGPATSSPNIGDEIIAIQGRTENSEVTNSSFEIGQVSSLPVIGDEIVAAQVGTYASLETMFNESPFDNQASSSSKIIIKIRRGPKSANAGIGSKAGRNAGSRFLDDGMRPPVRKGGIKSSTFARVMRLVADLPQAQVGEKPLRRKRAAHRPSVWADVSVIIETVGKKLMVSPDKSYAKPYRIIGHSSRVSICIRRWLSVICWTGFQHREF